MRSGTPVAKTKEPSSFRLIGNLAGVAMLSGILVAATFQVTREPIRENQRAALEKSVFAILPEATTRRNFLLDANGLQPLPDEALSEANVFAGYDGQGKLTGVAMEASARGYQDVVRLLYSYDPESGCIMGFQILQSSETPGLGDRVETDPDFLANFDCLEAALNDAGTALANPIVTVKNGKKEHPWEIDAISGATVTSAAIGTALDESASEMVPLLQRFGQGLMTDVEGVVATAERSAR